MQWGRHLVTTFSLDEFYGPSQLDDLKFSLQSSEIAKLKLEIVQMKAKLEADTEIFLEKEQSLVLEAENITKSNQVILEKIQKAEFRLKEQNIVLEQLQSQMINHEKDFKRSQTIDLQPIRSLNRRKLANPPKLLRRIHYIITKKQMLLPVFFSLMDKNNNGLIDVEEIFQCMMNHGKRIKKKDIAQALEMMNLPKNNAPITAMEENYEKYMYDQLPESPESSEELIQPAIAVKKNIESLSFITPNPEPISSDPIIPSESIQPRVVREIRKISTLKIADIQIFLDEIVAQMRALRLPKNKLLYHIFGNDIDMDKSLTVQELSQFIYKANLRFEKKGSVEILARFLIEPDGINEMIESQSIGIRGYVLDISRKLTKNLKDWEIYSEEEINKSIKLIENRLMLVKEALRESCKKIDAENTGNIKLSEFRKIAEELGEDIPEKAWDMWSVKLYPSCMVNYTHFIKKISPKPPEISLRMISDKLNLTETFPESIFTISNQGIITAEQFIEGVSKLELDLSNQDLFDLLEAIRFKGASSFTLIVHINDLRTLLGKHGFQSITISSSDDEANDFQHLQKENEDNSSDSHHSDL